MVVAMIALFMALSGTAWAVATIGPGNIKTNAVRARHIKDGQVQNKDLANGAVNSASVADESLTGADLGPDSVGSSEIANSAVQSSKLAANSVGSSSLKGTYAAVSAGVSPAANTYADGAANCNAGDRVLGGGFAWQNDADISTVYSTPDPLTNPNRWIVRSKSSAAGNTLYTWAVCLAA
jgi:hypothetical protein